MADASAWPPLHMTSEGGFKRDALSKRKESLFNMIDADGSGQIEKVEFDKLYDIVETHVKEEVREHQTLEKRVKTNKRRVAVLATFAVVLIGFLCLSVAANAAVIFVVVDKQVRGV